MPRIGFQAAAVAAAVLVMSAGTLTAVAHAENTPGDPIEKDGTTVVSERTIDRALDDATTPDSREEQSAVASYLADDPTGALTPSDLQVGTIAVSDDVEMTLVVPEVGAKVEGLTAHVDAESNSVSVGATLSDTDEPVTAGAGMGWPSWDDQPTWTVQDKIYVNGNWVGTATYQTTRRKYDGGTGNDQWEIVRKALVKPDEYEQTGPDLTGTVKKIWISNDLTSAAASRAQSWLLGPTNPQSQSDVCSSPSISAGPWSVGVYDCDEYDPWMGDAPNDIGHYRISYDQGTIAGGGQRGLGYISAFKMDENIAPSSTYYEFATIRLGYFGHSVSGDSEYKCTDERLGSSTSTSLGDCRF